jgi:hypothetical protein
MNIYESDIYTRTQTNYSVKLELRTLEHEIVKVFVKIYGTTRTNNTQIKYNFPNKGFKLLFYSERYLTAKELNAIELNLLTNADFIHIPKKYYAVNVIYKLKSLDEIYNDFNNFLLFIHKMDNFFIISNIPETIDYERKKNI